MSCGTVKPLNDTHSNCLYSLHEGDVKEKFKDCKSLSKELLDPEKIGLKLYLLEKSVKLGADLEGSTGQLSAKSVSAVASGGLGYLDSSEHSSQKDFRGQSPIKTAEKGRGRRSLNSCSSKRSAPKMNSNLSRSHEECAPKILKVLVSDSQAVRKGLSSATTVLSLAPPPLSLAQLAPRPEYLGLAYSVQYFWVLRLQTLESMALKVSVLVFQKPLPLEPTVSQTSVPVLLLAQQKGVADMHSTKGATSGSLGVKPGTPVGSDTPQGDEAALSVGLF